MHRQNGKERFWVQRLPGTSKKMLSILRLLKLVIFQGMWVEEY
jgi:hypothetical protein